MTKIKQCVVHFCILLFLNTAVSAQKLTYRVEYKGDSIGYMIAEKSIRGNNVIYTLNTKTNFTLLLSFDHHSYYESSFKDNILTQSLAESYLNDKEHSKTTVTLHQGTYLINKDDRSSTEVKPIYQSIASLYFTEPDSDAVFSEKEGAFCPIKKLTTSQYELHKPDDRKNIYNFKNGICNKVEINMKMATIILTRIK